MIADPTIQDTDSYYRFYVAETKHKVNTYQKIVAKFTGELTSCTLTSTIRLPNFPMGEYIFLTIKTDGNATAGEVCLFKTRAPFTEPMSRSSELSPVNGAEDASGKIIDSCFSLQDKPNDTVFTEGDIHYCLYKLWP